MIVVNIYHIQFNVQERPDFLSNITFDDVHSG
jgi:hypothetical protein